jgi:DNA-binding MarR family transcriptional regulator
MRKASYPRRRPAARRGRDGATVESIRRSLVSLRRLFQRKELADLWASAFGDHSKLDYGHLRLLDAARVSQSPETPAAATVGELARLLGVDPSRASRQVADAVAKGLLVRHAAQADGRKVVLRITARGARLQAKGSRVTRARIALALDAWRAGDRARLAALLDRFVVHLLLERPERSRRRS